VKDRLTIICGDALKELKKLPDESVQCCVTSPPYWGLRDYGHADQIGRGVL
jgi:DNA modification methylase